MLSILIPTYNYDVYKLAETLQQQCTAAGIVYEIRVVDDGSGSELNSINEKINLLPSCSFKALAKNIGRSAMRNLLAKEAQYNWLLFLDADTLPVDNSFIEQYLPYVNDDVKIVYGGIEYQKEPPPQQDLLRWVYGNGREVVPAIERAKDPYVKILTLNFLIHKKVFNTVRFNESIPNLRHEDTLFSYNLSQHKIKVAHAANPVYHLGLEPSETFIRKEEQSAEVLKYLIDNNLIAFNYVRVSYVHHYLKKTGLNGLAIFLFGLVKKPFINNLTGAHPSLLVFDLYRLGYLCSLK
jgi:glycosyltransferase involved in cell wall biosynthesis